MENKKKVEDGAYLAYVKDGKMYPVVLTSEQHAMLQAIVGGVFSPLKLAPYPQDFMTVQELREQGLMK